MPGGGSSSAGLPKPSDKILQNDGAQPEPAFRPITHETLTDVIDANSGNLPAARYPRASRENETNRFYVADAAAAGDMRAKLVQGEKFNSPTARGNDYDTGKLYDSGDTGGSPRGDDTVTGK